MFKISLILSAVFLTHMAHGKIVTRTVEYKEGNTILEGFLAYDDAKKEKRPGVLVVHEWNGLGDYVKKRTQDLAKLGYVAFAADIYGRGVRPADPKASGETSSIYKKNRTLFRARLLAGLEEVKKQKEVDPKRLAAIGYCFGGTGVLELARTGADVRGVVSFHGGLDSPTPEDGKKIKAKVLVLHGADDPFVSERDIKNFENELRSGGVDWQLIKYSKAVHTFTNPAAGSDPSKGSAYNADADRRSWAAMMAFFKEVLN